MNLHIDDNLEEFCKMQGNRKGSWLAPELNAESLPGHYFLTGSARLCIFKKLGDGQLIPQVRQVTGAQPRQGYG